MTEGQEDALADLQAIADASHDALEVLAITPPAGESTEVLVRVSVSCKVYPRAPEGLPLRDRELFEIHISAGFPFRYPWISTPHRRFAAYPHVQGGRWPCLYIDPVTEWNPNDGIFGFVQRLDDWLRKGARGELDPIGGPLHPPLTYATSEVLVIPRANTPEVGQSPWLGAAHLQPKSESRLDLVGWSQLPETDWQGEIATTILLSDPMPFEYPRTMRDLIRVLEERRVSRELLLLALQLASNRNQRDTPLYVVIGTPMRGIRGGSELRQHLAVWRIEPVYANGLRSSLHKYSEHEEIRELADEIEHIILEWADHAIVEWCSVREDRGEVTVRRDAKRPMSWFRGKSVALWGCGALGSYIGEYLVRAGVARLILQDYGTVAPGLLVRQDYSDEDIGRPKALALREHLLRIKPEGVRIQALPGDILIHPLSADNWHGEEDLIIDATASPILLTKLETRCRQASLPVPIASAAIGHQADKGIVAIVKQGYSGGPSDVLRKVRLEALMRPELDEYLHEFWPKAEERRSRVFQPEPGCSGSTFVGAATDCASLAGVMLNLVGSELSRATASSGIAHLVALPSVASGGCPSHEYLEFSPDRVVDDSLHGYEVRISEQAWASILRWIRRGHRWYGRYVETGGLLFGERADASRTIWITDASGPPADSSASPEGFICGVAGTAEDNQKKQVNSEGSIAFVGMWHTHPTQAPTPSHTDWSGMAKLLSGATSSSRGSLLLVVGMTARRPIEPVLGAFLYKPQDIQNVDPTLEPHISFKDRLRTRIGSIFSQGDAGLERLQERYGNPLVRYLRTLVGRRRR